MTNQPPLNPDALAAALGWFAEAVREVEVKFADDGTRPGDYWAGYREAKNEIVELLAEPELIKKSTRVALAVAQPEVTGEQINFAGWTCNGIHEPGSYATCEDCRGACDDLANFYNNMMQQPKADRPWTGRPAVNDA